MQTNLDPETITTIEFALNAEIARLQELKSALTIGKSIKIIALDNTYSLKIEKNKRALATLKGEA